MNGMTDGHLHAPRIDYGALFRDLTVLNLVCPLRIKTGLRCNIEDRFCQAVLWAPSKWEDGLQRAESPLIVKIDMPQSRDFANTA